MFGFLKRFRQGDPVCLVCSAKNLNRIANILEDLDINGGMIYKPTDREGKGWRIDIDPSNELLRFPWKCTVSDGTLSMDDGILLDMTSGASETLALGARSVLAADGYVYASIKVVATASGYNSVDYAASLPSASTGFIVVPIAYISSNGNVTQYVMGTLPYIATVPELV